MESPKNAATRTQSAGNLFVAGVLLLAVGLGIGFYFGKKAGSAPPSVTGQMAQPETQQPVMDPAAFLASETSLKSALAANPKDKKTLVELGNLYYDNSKFSEAVDYYGRALEIDPKDVNVRTDRGSCYWSLGQADEAISEFQQSLQVNPSHPQTLYNLGIVYLHGKNDIAEARRAWEKLLASNPDYPQRARIQQMLASMGGSAETPEQKSKSTGVEDLFKKMK